MKSEKLKVKNYLRSSLWVLLFSFSLFTFSFSLAVKFPYGHKPYREAPRESLVMVGTYRNTGRKERLRKDAAEAFHKMQQAAHQDKIHLIVISGFRSKDRQQPLWQRALKRYRSPEKAAFWVAPPGYSEHHTGWAMDLGDQDHPETDIEVSFEKTKAFQWLRQHAAGFGFELSFPKDNGTVHYEPWHWRFIHFPGAQELFGR